MKAFLQQIFQNPEGKFSMQRFRGFLAFLLAAVILIAGAFSESITFGDAMGPALILLGYSFGEKAFQNVTEMNMIKKK